MKKKLLHTLEEARETELRGLFQRAYVPEQLSSFEAALRSAKRRQQGQRRVMMVMASLVILSMLYALWPGSSANTIEGVRLTPVKTQEIAGQPETMKHMGGSLAVAPEKTLGSVYGPMNLVISDETGPIIFGGEGTPLLGLQVSVDGQVTEYKTPLVAPGIPLTPGAHELTFYGREGEVYGPYWVEIEAGQALEKDFSILKTPQHVLILDGQEINRSTSMPTSQTATKTGSLVAKTSIKSGLWVVIDGKKTGYKTPMKKPGIELSAGRHKLEFLDDGGKSYGTHTITIIAGELNSGDYALNKEALESAPTSAPIQR